MNKEPMEKTISLWDNEGRTSNISGKRPRFIRDGNEIYAEDLGTENGTIREREVIP